MLRGSLQGGSRCALLLVLLCVVATAACAGGPRFVTGADYPNVKPGTPMAFYTAQPAYFTDPADLSSTVTHAQADIMVAAAAAVWNVSTTSLTLTQGGVLAEHVSSANTYFDGTQMVFPEDVQPSNYLNAPIAVLYDTDGSLTDLLFGEGASDPGGCRQTGVTESVDAFGQDGTIHHAIIVLNGRCIDSASARPQQLLQMQYQLARIFGRVLGMGWSQLNDNVFTDATQPTAAEEVYWPLMHPIDVLCGSYTYQCMQNPFLLREDDISALMLLYPITPAALAAGKYYSYTTSDIIGGNLNFPTGQGMEEVNLTLRRGTTTENSYEPWEMVSALSGYQFQTNAGNPITGPVPVVEDIGSSDSSTEGTFYMASVDVTLVWSDITFLAEPINPLYTGDYAIGAYQGPIRNVSGTPQPFYGTVLSPWNYYGFNSTIAGAAATCNPGNDGTETAPAPSGPTGWWTGQICGVGHTSWWSATIQPNRTWTIETTALDETGNASTQKLQPLLGVWNANDAPGILPTLASATAPLNALALGMTQLQMPSSPNPQTVRIAIADAFGAGRPDFNYKARLLYADTLSPTSLGSNGGTITLTGTGFRPGNQVLVNGVRATVVTLTSTQIVAQAPSMALADPTGVAVDVEVFDSSTAGSSTILGALTYTPSASTPVLDASIAAAPRYLAEGASGSWTVSLLATQDAVPAPDTAVLWTSTTSLTVTPPQSSTGPNGIATVTANAINVAANSTNTLTGCAWSAVCASWNVYGVAASQWTAVVAGGAGQSLTAPATLAPVTLQITDAAGHALQGATVNLYQTSYAWEGPCPTTGPCPAAPVLATSQTAVLSDANGLLQFTPLEVPGVAQVVNIAASTGTLGFVSLSLTVKP